MNPSHRQSNQMCNSGLKQNNQVQCNLNMQASNHITQLPRACRTYWISIGTITGAATFRSKGHLSKTSMKPITIVYNLTIHILHHNFRDKGIKQRYQWSLDNGFLKHHNLQLRVVMVFLIAINNLLKLGKSFFVYFIILLK
jgi:hypothetical protein